MNSGRKLKVVRHIEASQIRFSPTCRLLESFDRHRERIKSEKKKREKKREKKVAKESDCFTGVAVQKEGDLIDRDKRKEFKKKRERGIERKIADPWFQDSCASISFGKDSC